MAERGARAWLAWTGVLALTVAATNAAASSSKTSAKVGTQPVRKSAATPAPRPGEANATAPPASSGPEQPSSTVEPVVARTTAAELEQRLSRAARAPEAVFEVPGTEWRLRIASVAVSIAGGDVLIALVPDPDIGSIRIRGRPNLVGRNAWRADRLQVSVDTPILAEQLESWIGQQIRGTEPRSLDAIFGPNATFTSAGADDARAPRVVPLVSEIRAGRLEPQALTVEGAAIRLAAELKSEAAPPQPRR